MTLKLMCKIAAGTAAAMAILVFAALRIDTTGSYERSFNAPPDRLWQVWTDPAFIGKWWGPAGYTAPVIRNDPRAGGTFLWSMQSPSGNMSWNTGVYREVVPFRRIVSTMSFADAAGKPIPGADVPVPGHWPDAILVTAEFEAAGGKTRVTVTEKGIPFFVKLLSAIAWSQQFDKIRTLL